MNFPGDTISDEALAFLLQQEEYGGPFEIQHIILPPSTASSSVVSLNAPVKSLSKPSIIVLDDSDEEEAPSKVVKAPAIPKIEEPEPVFLDVHEAFVKYNDLYFKGLLGAVTVEWSAKMTLCAGLCSWNRNGECRIKLSSKLLQYRTIKELKETLLHECIHAFLFVTRNNKDRDAHGPEFLKKMNEINAAGGFNISVYHSFHDEVNHFRSHWWQCNKCQYIVKRSMNRAPGPYDYWFAKHQRDCGGTYIKIKSPEVTDNPKKRKRDSSIGPNSEPDQTASKKPKPEDKT